MCHVARPVHTVGGAPGEDTQAFFGLVGAFCIVQMHVRMMKIGLQSAAHRPNSIFRLYVYT